jgi:hypothetical protein
MTHKVDYIFKELKSFSELHKVSIYSIIISPENFIFHSDDEYSCEFIEMSKFQSNNDLVPFNKKDFSIDVLKKVIKILEHDLDSYKKHLKKYLENNI